EAAATRALISILLLSPQIPLLFMGEEWGARQPFLFFTDFHDELADAVREGRRREFAKFPAFADPAARAHIPDPNDITTFEAAKLDWAAREEEFHAERLALVRDLLRLRQEHIVPLRSNTGGTTGRFGTDGDHGLRVDWRLGGAELHLLASLGGMAEGGSGGMTAPADSTLLYESEPGLA